MGTRLENIYRDNKRWLFERVRLRAGNFHTAEDVVGETFVQMAEHRTLDEINEPRALLVTIARRVLFEMWRRRDLERAYLEQLALAPERLAPSPEETLTIVQALAAVDAALAKLPPKPRQAFVMCQLSDMTYADIATAVSVSASMVRQYVAKGMQSMLEAVGGHRP